MITSPEEILAQIDNGMPPGWVGVAEISSVLGVSKMTVLRRIHAGDIPAIRVGQQFRVRERALVEYVKNATVHVCVCTHGEV